MSAQPPKRGRGRPPAAAEERRAHHRATRLDARELELLQRLAAALDTTEGDVLRLGLEALARAHRLPL